MSSEANRLIVSQVMDALARGETEPFVAAMAEEFTWRVMGARPWLEGLIGRGEVQGRLMKDLFSHFATNPNNKPTRILADGDFVVVECSGEITTQSGASFRNAYCYVIRMENSMITQLTEYMDTAFAAAPVSLRSGGGAFGGRA